MIDVIFVSGIHGVGKTTLCQYISSKNQVEHYSASSLIKAYTETQTQNKKFTENIADNQNVLLKAIRNLKINSQCLLLDGHFCLLDKAGVPSRIPKDVFKELSLSAIVHIYDDVDNILRRIELRDGIKYNRGLLIELQSYEDRYSREMSGELQIPYITGNAIKDKEELSDTIKELIGVVEQ